MPSALVPLANTTLGSPAIGITFSSISGLYRDLIIVVTGTSAPALSPYIRFNGDTGSNYTVVRMSGSGSAAVSKTVGAGDRIYWTWDGAVNSTVSNSIIHVMDYSATNKHKTILTRFDNSSNITEANAGRWASTSAITSISLTGTANWDSGTTFALYGVSA